jgi:hypothetical protein
MAYEQKDNSGSLFRNDKREKETHPQAKGRAMIDGVMYWVSAWTKTPNAGGEKYQSLSFKKMEVQPNAPSQAPAREGSAFDGEPLDSEIPFRHEQTAKQPL